MDKDKWGVHEAHCCVLHGCKYMNEDCPVFLEQTEQEYTCEWCSDEGIHSVADVKTEQRKDEIQVMINSNVCPHCQFTSMKKLIYTDGTSDLLWCYACRNEFTIIYKRIPVEISLDKKEYGELDGFDVLAQKYMFKGTSFIKEEK